MGSLTNMLKPGAAPAWLLLSSGILLGALHGLEPGHSKTMMTAFIVAVRGTVGQAVTLGIAATVSHTAVVWIVALVGMQFGGRFNAETNELYFQVTSAMLIIVIAVLMLLRAWRAQQRARSAAQRINTVIAPTLATIPMSLAGSGQAATRMPTKRLMQTASGAASPLPT